MTFVGKILVIFIMIFALFFLALSSVVFTTQKNWRSETQELQKKVADLQKSKSDAETSLAQGKTQYEGAQKDFETKSALLDSQLTALKQENAQRQQTLTQIQTDLAEKQEILRAAVAEAEKRRGETEQLREKLSAVEKQANDFKIAQTELQDEIRVLERQLETATSNNKDLRERVALLSGELRRVGLSDDVSRIKSVSNVLPPEPVEGFVRRVDAQNKRVEISIGADDGLVAGHELELYRTKPFPEYIGKIRIESVDPDQAVGVVIGKTINGKKIQEGDIVSPKIIPGS